LTPKEEKEDIKDYIEILKEELKEAEEQLKGPGKSKKK
jgi:cell division septum initiation protein DivIVA